MPDVPDASFFELFSQFYAFQHSYHAPITALSHGIDWLDLNCLAQFSAETYERLRRDLELLAPFYVIFIECRRDTFTVADGFFNALIKPRFDGIAERFPHSPLLIVMRLVAKFSII